MRSYEAMSKPQYSSRLLFAASVELPQFSSKKNRKVIRRNFRTGQSFIGSDSKHQAIDNLLVSHLRRRALELHLASPIAHPVCAVFWFFGPEWLTKKGTISQRAGDLSNLIQGPEDCLVKANIIEDDSQILSYGDTRKILSPTRKLEISLYSVDLNEYFDIVE